MAWHPDGKSLAAACEDTQVYVWDAEAGKREMVLEGHHAQVTKVAFNRSGSLLASRSWDKTTRLWDMTSGDLLVRVPGRHVGFSRHDDHRLGFHSGIWRIGSGQECRDIQIPGRSSGGTFMSDFSPERRLLVQAPLTTDGGGHLYDGPSVLGLASYPYDLMNGSLDGAMRRLISDVDARILGDAYGYTMTVPSTQETFLANYNSTLDWLTVNGDPQVLDALISIDCTGHGGVLLSVDVDGVGASFPIASISSIFVNSSGGDDVHNIRCVPTDTPMAVDAGDGYDTINVGTSANSLDLILGPLTIDGGPDWNYVNLNDSGDTGSNTYRLVGDTVERAGIPVIEYRFVTWLVLNTTLGDDVVDVFAPWSGVEINTSFGSDTINVRSISEPTIISAGLDEDTITIGDPIYGLDGILQYVLVSGDLGRADALTLLDESSVVSRAFGMGDDWIVWGPDGYSAYVGYSGIETVTVNMGSGGDWMAVQGTNAATSTFLNGGGGDDEFWLPNGPHLDPVLGPVTVNGGAGSNSLLFNDQESATAAAYTLTATTFQRTGTAVVTYSGIQSLSLNAGLGDDTITIVSTAPGAMTTINGGGGTDSLTGPNAESTWTLSAADAGLLDAPQGATRFEFASIANLLGGTSNDTFVFNSAGTLSGSIDGGLGMNGLNYALHDAGVVVNLRLASATGLGGSFSRLQNVTGGYGHDIIVGDVASNVLIGGAGNDLIIAGGDLNAATADVLIGDEGEDVLIAGWTRYDMDAAALSAILASWTAPASYTTRVNNLRLGIGVPALNRKTVFYNQAAGGNTLLGGADLDLFYANRFLDHHDWNSATETLVQLGGKYGSMPPSRPKVLHPTQVDAVFS